MSWLALLSLALGPVPVLQDPAPAPQETPVDEPGSEEASPTDPVDPPAVPTGPPRLERALDLEEVAAALERLVLEHPEVARLETIARSRSGREVQLVTLTDGASGAEEEKPGVLVLDFRPGAAAFGAEAVLAIGWTIAELASSDPEVAELLARDVIYLAPACDPDVRSIEDGVEPEPIRFELNFPLGWWPDTLRPGSGAIPLARPEVEAVARFLREHPNVVLVLGIVPAGRTDGEPWPGAVLPAADRDLLETLGAAASSGEARLVPWQRLGSPGGGPLDYAYQALGIHPLAWVAPAEPTPEELLAWTSEVAAGTIELLSGLPRLALEMERLEELAPGLWELDLALRNNGVLPTTSRLGVERRRPAPLGVLVEGAQLVATARRAASEGPFRRARLAPAGEPILLDGGPLAGGETRWLRLVLEGAKGDRVRLAGVGPLAGGLALELVLQ